MESKEIYFKELIKNNGQLNEIDLGEELGLNEDNNYRTTIRT